MAGRAPSFMGGPPAPGKKSNSSSKKTSDTLKKGNAETGTKLRTVQKAGDTKTSSKAKKELSKLKTGGISGEAKKEIGPPKTRKPVPEQGQKPKVKPSTHDSGKSPLKPNVGTGDKGTKTASKTIVEKGSSKKSNVVTKGRTKTSGPVEVSKSKLVPAAPAAKRTSKSEERRSTLLVGQVSAPMSFVSPGPRSKKKSLPGGSLLPGKPLDPYELGPTSPPPKKTPTSTLRRKSTFTKNNQGVSEPSVSEEPMLATDDMKMASIVDGARPGSSLSYVIDAANEILDAHAGTTEVSPTEKEDPIDQELGEDNYEEDFEDYESDFEEDVDDEDEEEEEETESDLELEEEEIEKTVISKSHPVERKFQGLGMPTPSAMRTRSASPVAAQKGSRKTALISDATSATRSSSAGVASGVEELRAGTRDSPQRSGESSAGSRYRESPGSASYPRVPSSRETSSRASSFTDDDKKMEALRRAIYEENETLSKISLVTSAPAATVSNMSRDLEGREKSPVLDHESHQKVQRKSSSGRYNFSSATKVVGGVKSIQASREAQKRARDLADVIQLESSEIDLLVIEPFEYTDYIASFGKKNRLQRAVQSNEDNQEAETQTETREKVCRWTQKPIAFHVPAKLEELETFVVPKDDFHGVGLGDTVLEVESEKRESGLGYSTWEPFRAVRRSFVADPGGGRKISSTNVEDRYAAFVESAGKMILSVLAELGSRSKSTMGSLDVTDAANTVLPLTFAKPSAKIQLSKEQISSTYPRLLEVKFSEYNSEELLCLHVRGDQLSGFLISVWSMSDLTHPNSLLSSAAIPTCLASAKNQTVVVGTADGNLQVWSMDESLTDHRERFFSDELVTRAPGYTAGMNSDDPIVAIASRSSSNSNDSSASEICSLTENGTVKFWLLVAISPELQALNSDPGLAHWSIVTLTGTRVIELKRNPGTLFHALLLCPVDTVRFLVAVSGDDPGMSSATISEEGAKSKTVVSSTSSSSTSGVIQCSKDSATSSGSGISGRSYPRMLRIAQDRVHPLCMDFFPFGGHPYFLAGFSDGCLQLFSLNTPSALTSWSCAASGSDLDPLSQEGHMGAPIVQVRWSRTRPCVFFAKDAIGTVFLWDLCMGDLAPRHVVPALSSQVAILMDICPGESSGMVYGSCSSADGPVFDLKVGVYDLLPEYVKDVKSEDFQQELERFLHYVAIL